MAGNPFHYGTPVDTEHFAGRREELAALLARMEDGINVMLVSPRRYGKTSLLLLAEERVRRRGAVVHVNLLRCRDVVDLAAKLAGAAYHLPSGRWHRARNAAGEFARRLRVAPTVAFGPDGTPKFGFSAELGPRDARTVLADVYALLADDALSRPAVLALDEFQAVTDLGAHLPGVLKSLADEHQRVALVVAGSRAHLMERLTRSTGAPLYGMAERLALGPVDPADMAAYLTRRAAAGAKPMAAGVAQAIIARGGPVPNDIQRLAYASYEASARRIGFEQVDLGMAATVGHDAATFAEAFGRLPTGQRRVLAAYATGPVDEPFSARFARSVGLATGASVRKAVDALVTNDVLVRRDDTWQVADPFFAAWLRDW